MDEIRFKKLLSRAAANGAVYENFHFHWKISGDCESPYDKFIEGRLTPSLVDSDLKSLLVTSDSLRGIPLSITLALRCRACDNCLKAKKNRWFHRCKRECERASRNWFVTLTLGRTMRQLEDKQILVEFQKHVTKFFKRIRKNSKCKFRYLAIYELHKDGTPHAHIIIHDTTGLLLHRHIASEWRIGFEKTKLVDNKIQKTVSYVVKYLLKNPVTRIRSSLNYGLDHSPSVTTDVNNPTP